MGHGGGVMRKLIFPDVSVLADHDTRWQTLLTAHHSTLIEDTCLLPSVRDELVEALIEQALWGEQGVVDPVGVYFAIKKSGLVRVVSTPTVYCATYCGVKFEPEDMPARGRLAKNYVYEALLFACGQPSTILTCDESLYKLPPAWGDFLNVVNAQAFLAELEQRDPKAIERTQSELAGWVGAR